MEAAQIGATIEMNGRTLPYRPAAVEAKRGGTQHKGGLWSCIGILLLDILVGAIDVPGGLCGVCSTGPFGLWDLKPLTDCKDGLITAGTGDASAAIDLTQPYLAREVSAPVSLTLTELMPCSYFRANIPLTHFTIGEISDSV